MVDDRFSLTRTQALELADDFGTPLYVLDEVSFRSRLQRYRKAFEAVWPKTQLSYASKANSIFEVLRIAHDEGFHIDVASEGELRAALAAGIPAAKCHMHGNAKSLAELEYATEIGVGQVIADNFIELDRLAALPRVPILLRLAPGVDPKTHRAISTGQADTKFGFNIQDGSAKLALKKALDHGLEVIGFHCHVGSQLLDPEAQRTGGVELAEFARIAHKEFSFESQIINIGGGLGVRYLAEDRPTPIEEYCRMVVEAMSPALSDGVTLGQEPGRSVIAESGVTLYTVQVIKPVGNRTYVVVDGGLSDNPRSVMYGAKYDVLGFRESLNPKTVTVSGKHCETDTLFEDVPLPEATAAGDLLQVLVTGAYNASMASNYNRFLRPATVMISQNGGTKVLQSREKWAELFSRDV